MPDLFYQIYMTFWSLTTTLSSKIDFKAFKNKCFISHTAILDTSKIDSWQIPLKFQNRDDQSTFLVTFIENLEPRITKAGHNVGLKMRPNS